MRLTRCCDPMMLCGTPQSFYRLRSEDEIRHRQAALVRLELSRHELVRLHPVREWPLIAQIVHEIHPGSTSKYILLDVEFHNHLPALVPETVRQAKLVPSALTRNMLMSILSLTPYCRHVANCIFWLNHKVVPTDSPSALDLQHGDYIRIAVPPSPDCKTIDTRTAALLHHHEFGPSDYQRMQNDLPDYMDPTQMPTEQSRIDSLHFSTL